MKIVWHFAEFGTEKDPLKPKLNRIISVLVPVPVPDFKWFQTVLGSGPNPWCSLEISSTSSIIKEQQLMGDFESVSGPGRRPLQRHRDIND